MSASPNIPPTLLDATLRLANRYSSGEGLVETDIPDLSFYLATRTSEFSDALYETVVCLVLQGEKEIVLGGRRVGIGPGACVIVSHDLPVISKITRADRAAPYLAIALKLDLPTMRGLAADIGDHRTVETPAPEQSLHVIEADPALLDAFDRCLATSETPLDRAILLPLVVREIHFRLMQHTGGAMLRRLAAADSRASRIARAIAMIRSDARRPISVPDLAAEAGMSASAFHQSFKAITAMTPLQYGKALRLAKARELLINERLSVAATAYEVGYESPTQFSREFARRFGLPPRDVLRGETLVDSREDLLET